MSVRNVEVVAGCISCRTCESVCPSVFKVDPTSRVINRDFLEHAKEIFLAAKLCPVQVIKVEKEAEAEVELDRATVSKIDYLTPDTVELSFSAKNFRFVPGQYVSVSFADAEGEFTRAYSVVSGNADGFSLAVKLLPNGRGAAAIRKLKQDDELPYAGGMGHFVLKDTPSPKAFVATGTGIAPMVAMLEALSEETKKTVVFGVRSENDLFYADRLKAFANTEVVVTVSRPSEGWKGARGRVTEHLSGIDPSSEAYICGSPEMVEEVRKKLAESGFEEANVFYEAFVSQATKTDKPSLLRRVLLDGEIPGISAVQWTLIALSATVPFVWGFFPAYRQSLWDVSWISAVALMSIRPLADLFPKMLFLRALVPLRKGLGILSAAVVATNLGFLAYGSPAKLASTYLSAKGWGLGNFAAFGRVSEITGVALLATSNNFSQKLL